MAKKKVKEHYVKILLKRLSLKVNKKAKHKVININNYERFWEDSTPTGHQIRIVCQDD